MPAIVTLGAMSAKAFGFTGSTGAQGKYFIYMSGYICGLPPTPGQHAQFTYGGYVDACNNIYNVGTANFSGICNGYTGGFGTVVKSCGTEKAQLQFERPSTGAGCSATASIIYKSPTTVGGNTFVAGTYVQNNQLALFKFSASGCLTNQKSLSTFNCCNVAKLVNSGSRLYTFWGNCVTRIQSYNTCLTSTGNLFVKGVDQACPCGSAGNLNLSSVSNVLSCKVFTYGQGLTFTGCTPSCALSISQFCLSAAPPTYVSTYQSNQGGILRGNNIIQDSTYFYFLYTIATTLAITKFNKSSYARSWTQSFLTNSTGQTPACGQITTDNIGNVYAAVRQRDSSYNGITIFKLNSSGTTQWIRRVLYNPSNNSLITSLNLLNIDQLGDLVLNATSFNNSNTQRYTLVLRIPTDGSHTGSYTVGSYGTVSYQAYTQSCSILSTPTLTSKTFQTLSQSLNPSNPTLNSKINSTIPKTTLII